MRVVVNDCARAWFARSRVVNRDNLLRSAGLSASNYPLRVNGSEDPARGAVRPTCHKPKNTSLFSSNLRRHHLIENFRWTVILNLGLHQIALKISYSRDVQSHLKRRHLSRVPLPETFQRQIELSYLGVCINRSLARSKRAFDCI